jgi:hypothetical protein
MHYSVSPQVLILNPKKNVIFLNFVIGVCSGEEAEDSWGGAAEGG